MESILLFIGVALVTIAPALHAQATDRWQPIRDLILRNLQEANGAAMTVAVAKDGKIIWEEGFGWANREKMVRATPHTMFSLASISKPITATGLMALVQRGKVDIDRPANEYLGAGKLTGLAGDPSNATVKRILSHTSGLPLHYQFFYSNEGILPPTMDETISRYGVLVAAPGETFRYSNLGYGILDYIISRVSGQSYADFMRSEIFLPLGLTRMSVDIAPGLEDEVAERYDSRGRPIPFYAFDHAGGSAVYSSAHDLVRFGMFHLKNHLPDQKPIFSDSLIDKMKVPQTDGTFGEPRSSYDLGWITHKNRYDRGYDVVEHGGGMPGVATTLKLYPSENLAIVALTNGGGNPFSIAEDIAGVMLPRYGDSLKAQRARKRPDPTPAKFTAPPELTGAWKGTVRTWRQTLPFGLTVEQDGDVKVQLGTETTGGADTRGDKQLPALLSGTEWNKGLLSGRFAGTIPTPDASRVPHTIQLELKLVGGKLRGQASAQSNWDPMYFSLASYVELTKQ